MIRTHLGDKASFELLQLALESTVIAEMDC